ncbi:Obg family GTPase CgtA, partial [Chloroflexota bacterium]
IIGSPNAGKSTLLAATSKARPAIGSYPFTTREPVLGVIEVGRQTFVMAEIPGLIEGAHLGRGLGHDFLRHIIRTRILIHLVDGSAPSPVEDMVKVNAELNLFDQELAKKLQIVAINKIDLPQVQARLAELRDTFGSLGTKVLFISAATDKGVSRLMEEVLKLLSEVAATTVDKIKIPQKVFRPQPRTASPRLYKEGATFVIVSPELERIIAGTDMNIPGVRWRFQKQLSRLGITQALKKAGAKSGDKVRIGYTVWEW